MPKPKQNIKTLKPIKSPRAIERDFLKRLKRLSTDINKSVLYWANARANKAIDKNISTQLTFEFNALLKEWEQKTKDISKILAKKMARQVKNYVDSNLKSQDKAFHFKTLSRLSQNALNAIYNRNLALIESIPQEIINRYRNAFLNSVNNYDREQMLKLARQYQGISNRRAKMIARDQTQKAVSDFTQARSRQLGFTHYKWVTSRDERVSEEHKHLDGRIYAYDNPTAIIDKYGNVGNPSQRVNCRCVCVSVILEHNQELKLIKDGKYGDYYVIKEK